MQGLLGIWKANQVISRLEKVVIDLVQKITTFINLITLNKTGNLLNSMEAFLLKPLSINTPLNIMKQRKDISFQVYQRPLN